MSEDQKLPDNITTNFTGPYPNEIGFEDLTAPYQICPHPEHHAPSHLCVPQGKRYRHVCPQCRSVSYIYPTRISY